MFEKEREMCGRERRKRRRAEIRRQKEEEAAAAAALQDQSSDEEVEAATKPTSSGHLTDITYHNTHIFFAQKITIANMRVH